MAQTLYS